MFYKVFGKTYADLERQGNRLKWFHPFVESIALHSCQSPWLLFRQSDFRHPFEEWFQTLLRYCLHVFTVLTIAAGQGLGRCVHDNLTKSVVPPPAA